MPSGLAFVATVFYSPLFTKDGTKEKEVGNGHLKRSS